MKTTERLAFPHPDSDAIVDSAVEVPFVEPAGPKHTDPSPSSSATASSPSSFGRGQRCGILENTIWLDTLAFHSSL